MLTANLSLYDQGGSSRRMMEVLRVTSKFLRTLAVLLFAAMMLSATAFAAPMTYNQLTVPAAYTTGAYGVNEVPEGKSPTTGLDWEGEYRPVLVQISNSDGARPHWNMSEADIVYESLLWGPGHTRYSCLFNDNHPEFVGAVRSARLHHCQLRQEWDCPFVFYGGQDLSGTSIYDFFKDNNVPTSMRFDGIKGDYGVLSRTKDRVSPHNAVVNLKKLVEEKWPTNDDGAPYEPVSHAFKFSDTDYTRGYDSAVKMAFSYADDYEPSYVYDVDAGVYNRYYNGQQMFDGYTNKPIVASNVIVQYCETYFYGGISSRPVVELTGSGVCDVFIGGEHIRGSWSRKAVGDRTIFMDLNGEEVTFKPGKTFVQIIASSDTFTYTEGTGKEHEVDVGYEVKAVDYGEVDASELDNMASGEK